ncbi:MAG: YeeE/YedE family protein [Proteobacteria bacterium]|nr:YeeE/YedE family protein [Pseudomonadota bacterium]
MKLIIVALISGILFGAGLTLSQMTNPEKVLNFLDIAGNWDPSLVFVMIGSLAVTSLFFRKILNRPRPLFDKEFYLSSKSVIDRPLLIGAAIFGIGWGISGYCPGPSVAGLGLGNVEAVVMIFSVYLGFVAHRLFIKKT